MERTCGHSKSQSKQHSRTQQVLCGLSSFQQCHRISEYSLERAGGIHPLPWAANPLLQLGPAFENEQMENDFIRFLESRPQGSKVGLLMRGIDGASIDPGSYLFLQRFDNLDITIAFSVAEIFVRHRLPAFQTYFTRTPVYDQRLYGFWTLTQLTDYVRGYTQDAKSAWLVGEWRLGRIYRQDLSIAFQTMDPVRIGHAQRQFKLLYTGGRNEVPVVPLPRNNGN